MKCKRLAYSQIVVAPLLTPSSNSYDAELIFAGPGNKSIDYFSALNATLGLYYLNRSDRFVNF
ncbi:MAG: thermopsin family protease, partial [Candidatus Micrarchaeaceae archaeon]